MFNVKLYSNDCGTHPIANPTRPRSSKSHPKLGATELSKPYRNNKTPHNVNA